MDLTRAYCQSCGKELTKVGGDLINNSLYCRFDISDCGVSELKALFNENIGIYDITGQNCDSRLIQYLDSFDIQEVISEGKEINHSIPLFLPR